MEWFIHIHACNELLKCGWGCRDQSNSDCIWSSVRARDIVKKNEATKAPSRIDSQNDMPRPPFLRGRHAFVEACPENGTPVMASKASACTVSKFGASVDKASG